MSRDQRWCVILVIIGYVLAGHTESRHGWDIYLYLHDSQLDSSVLLPFCLLRVSSAVYQQEVASHACNPSCWISHPEGEVILDSQLCLFGWLLPSGRAMLPKCTWLHFVAAGVISQGRRCSSASWPHIQVAPIPRICDRASGRLQRKGRNFTN